MDFSGEIKRGFINLEEKVIVTDPCYKLQSKLGIILNNVLSGKYL